MQTLREATFRLSVKKNLLTVKATKKKELSLEIMRFTTL